MATIGCPSADWLSVCIQIPLQNNIKPIMKCAALIASRCSCLVSCVDAAAMELHGCILTGLGYTVISNACAKRKTRQIIYIE
jgi:hypothetical protein